MISFLRRRPFATAEAVTLCETCGQVCTARCRADVRRDRIRARALTYLPHLR